jgi:hypothetical protein
VDTRGVASNSLYALGVLRRGLLWETTAVPELRVQVAEMAKLLLCGHLPPDAGIRKFLPVEDTFLANVASRSEETSMSNNSPLGV